MTARFQDWVAERKVVEKEKSGGKGILIHTCKNTR